MINQKFRPTLPARESGFTELFNGWQSVKKTSSKKPKMKTLFTGESVSLGGRSGSVRTPDGMLNTELGNPLEPGKEKRGPNPEQLFASAYSACYHGALLNVAKKQGVTLKDSSVRALVSLLEDDAGGYHLGVELRGKMPGVDRAQGEKIMQTAHQTCPYSKALRGDAKVKLTVE
jgi:Ohr subfamily peroxiredoxin